MESNSKLPFDLQAFLATANGGRTISTYRANQTIFSQGESADSVFYIQEGKVKLTVLSEQGKEAIVAILGTGDFCGEGCLAGQPRRMATAAAMADSSIMRLEKAAMIRLLHDEPEFSERFMSHLLARNVRVEADLVDQLFNSSEKRLARLIGRTAREALNRTVLLPFLNKPAVWPLRWHFSPAFRPPSIRHQGITDARGPSLSRPRRAARVPGLVCLETGRHPYPLSGPPLNLALASFDSEPFTRRRIKHSRGSVKRQRKMRKKAAVSKKATVQGRVTSPAEYRQFAVESVQRCIAAPNKNKRRKAVHLMMAQAWAKLADQAEEWRMHHPRQQRHRAA